MPISMAHLAILHHDGNTPNTGSVAISIFPGNTIFSLSENGDSFNMDGQLSFINAGDSVVDTLYVNIPGYGINFNDESATNQPNAGDNLIVQGGFQVRDGALTSYMTAGTTLTLDGNSTITSSTDVNPATGALVQSSYQVSTNDTGPTLGTTLDLNGTITLGAIGQNILGLEDVNTVGGTVISNGEGDLVHVGINPNGDPDEGIGTTTGTDFQLNGGVMTILGPSGFGGTIGPVSSSAPNAPVLGIFASVEILNAMAAASATFDTSTGVLSILDASNHDIGDIHMAGDPSGLFLNLSPGGVLNLHDTGGQSFQGNIPLTFHA
jgi:hypothetical protein